MAFIVVVLPAPFAHQRNEFALSYFKIDAFYRVNTAIGDLQIADLQDDVV